MSEERVASKPQAKGPELFIGLVGAVGTDLGLVTEFLSKALSAVGYSTSRFSQKPGEAGPPPTNIRLAKLLHQLSRYKDLPSSPFDEYVNQHMSAGDEFRRITGMADALAVMGIIEIMDERKAAESEGALSDKKTIPQRAYVLSSLKNPKELETLRQVYDDGFFLLAAYSRHDARRDYLARQIADSQNDYPAEAQLSKAEALIQRDQEEIGISHGQNVRGIFHKADVFVDTTDRESLRESVYRFVELLFGNTFRTPTRDEYGMFHAHAAALRSAEPGRQVGAAIATDDGDIIAVGVNEVPRAGGGLYWCDDNPDGREFQHSQESGNNCTESNQRQIRNLVADTLKHLKNAGWLEAAKSAKPTDELVEAALSTPEPPTDIAPDVLKRVFEFLKRADWLSGEKKSFSVAQLMDLATSGKSPAIPKGAQIRNLIEFGRAVHAEMAALIDAARRGVAVMGATMYVTTFPCHLCARHIVAAGIRRVVYVEPYAKSRTADLYPDSIAIEQSVPNKVQFEPFVGLAPRQYMKLFSRETRMSDGQISLFDPSKALPMQWEPAHLPGERRRIGDNSP